MASTHRVVLSMMVNRYRYPLDCRNGPIKSRGFPDSGIFFLCKKAWFLSQNQTSIEICFELFPKSCYKFCWY